MDNEASDIIHGIFILAISVGMIASVIVALYIFAFPY